MSSGGQQVSKTRSGKTFKQNKTRVYFTTYEDLKKNHKTIFQSTPSVDERTRVSITKKPIITCIYMQPTPIF